MSTFDVVVIGSGMGGLSAAAALAKAGKRVLVLEKHNVPGGCATSFVRGRFEFEVALHELSGLGSKDNQGPLYRILSSYGVYPRVNFVKIPDVYKSYFPDFEITVPVGRENFEKALCDQFPECKDSIMKMSSIFFSFAKEYAMGSKVGLDTARTNSTQFPHLSRYYGKTMDEVICPIVPDERVRAVFEQMWSYLCLPPNRCSFDIYALLMSAYITFGPGHIRGTSQALSQAFVEAIESYGGEVWLNNGARRILTKSGKVTGVITAQGQEIPVSSVVCNANPLSVCYDMIGPENVPGWFLKRLNGWTGGGSFLIAYLGLDRPYTDLGVTSHENFINLGYDLNRQFEMCSHSLTAEPDGMAFTLYNVADARFSPEGTSNVVLCAISYTEPWLKLTDAEYEKFKDRGADRLITLGEKIVPGLRDCIEVMEVATPLTIGRYTASPGGSVVGFDETFQVIGQRKLPRRGPLQGLYFSSAWVGLGGGFEPCIENGAYTAREVLHDLGESGRDVFPIERLKTEIETESYPYAGVAIQAWRAEQESISRRHPNSLLLKIVAIRAETPSTSTFRLESVNGSLPYFRAGQYINVSVNINGIHTNRPYSISSAPGKPYYEITVRRVNKGFVSDYLLDTAKKGQTLTASGPHGNFYYNPVFDQKTLVMLAGGSGITPFMSMIRQELEDKTGLNIYLIYGSRVPEDIVFGRELKQIASDNPNIKVDLVMSEPPVGWDGRSGFLDAKVIQSIIGSIEDKTFMMCGPAQMYDLCSNALRSMGIPMRRIRREVYGPPADISLETGWPGISPTSVYTVREERSNKMFHAVASEPLLVSMERAGLASPSVCRSGECTACRTKLLQGSVFSPQRVVKRWIDDKGKYIHPCMSYPLEDLTIRL